MTMKPSFLHSPNAERPAPNARSIQCAGTCSRRAIAPTVTRAGTVAGALGSACTGCSGCLIGSGRVGGRAGGPSAWTMMTPQTAAASTPIQKRASPRTL